MTKCMTQPRRPPIRKNDPAGVKERILDAASDLFQSRGYADTTTEAIRKAAGVSGGALHYHFPTKKDLGLAVVRERVAPAVEAAWIRPVEMSRHAADGIRDAFGGVAREVELQDGVRGCPLNNLVIELAFADAEFREELEPIFERWKGAIAERLWREEAVEQPNADSLATLIVAAYSGAMTMAKSSQSPKPLVVVMDALEHQVDLFRDPAVSGRKRAASGRSGKT